MTVSKNSRVNPPVVLPSSQGGYETVTLRAAIAIGALSAVVLQHRDETPKFIARKAVEMADEMIEALNG